MTKQRKQKDVYQEVTDTIIKSLEGGVIPWIKPWSKSTNTAQAGMPYNGSTGRAYHGLNVMLCWAKQYGDDRWLSFNQGRKIGGRVIKGEKSTLITYWKFIQKKDENGNKIEGEFFPLLKHHNVFNVEQFEGLDMSKLKEPEVVINEETTALDFARNSGALVGHGGDKAFYSPSMDRIQMPNQKQFKEVSDYDSTLTHELTHWTGHENRCDRDFGSRFGSNDYAFEELVAEIGSAYLNAILGIPKQELQHTAYIQNWLQVLKADKKAIVTASSQARKATQFLLEANGIKEEKSA